MSNSENQSAADKAALIEVPEVAEWLALSIRAGVSAGIWGWLDDDLAWAKPWGFDVADIRVPVIVRHGDEDGFVSIEQGRWLAAHIPGARFDEMPGGGHTTVGVPIDPVTHGPARCRRTAVTLALCSVPQPARNEPTDPDAASASAVITGNIAAGTSRNTTTSRIRGAAFAARSCTARACSVRVRAA